MGIFKKLKNWSRPDPKHKDQIVLPPTAIWLDIGAHLGEKTFEPATQNSRLFVYAFEPILSLALQRMGKLPNYCVIPMAISDTDGSAIFHVNKFDAASSLLSFNADGLAQWIGGGELDSTHAITVPTVRLDTFMNAAKIAKVDFLKVDAQGADLTVLRSAGKRLRDIDRVTLEVTVTPVQLYEGAADKNEVLGFMNENGFQLIDEEGQSHGQEENLTFVRRP